MAPDGGRCASWALLDGIAFAQHIDLLGVREKRSGCSLLLSWSDGWERPGGSLWPPQLAFLRCTIWYGRSAYSAPW